MDNRHLFSRRKYSNKTNPKERVEAHGFGLTSGRSPRRASASIDSTCRRDSGRSASASTPLRRRKDV